MDERQKGVRLWCVAARKAPIIGVIARYRGEKSWGCVLRWNWEKRKVEEGAWTTMRIHAGRCVLSEDGEFLYYHAKGPVDGLFDGYYGGAFAISRLPWLSALTDTRRFEYGWDGSKSRDALSEGEQERLWKLFKGARLYYYDEHWPYPLGHGWKAAAKGSKEWALAEEMVKRDGPRLVAERSVAGSRARLLAVVTRKTWNLWDGHVRFVVVSGDEVKEMKAWRWARPVGMGRVAVATGDARLKMVRVEEGEEVEWEKDLSGLEPRPGPAPKWAKAGLKG